MFVALGIILAIVWILGIAAFHFVAWLLWVLAILAIISFIISGVRSGNRRTTA